MKIIKKILLPLVLFLSLFFNTSTIFAGNNLSTTFNANNDELTVTVKNNSDKELSDVEYNLNLPSEYTAKYEVNPNYSLSPQEETTFKVKVSKSGDNVSNNGEQGTKTFKSSKKTLDNTGLTSELTVGVIILLFLLVGVLLYFKQRKVFIILLVAGIGTQLFPRYSFAANKIRQTENFKEYVTLLENNIPISLDVSYLIEGDSNNNGNNNGNTTNNNNNNGNTNNNGNNSGNNGLNSNDKDPKEVLVAGYAYSGKTNNILEEKELKVFDGDKEIATVKTDTEGYFFTHLIQDKTYTIKGEDFEVTVTAKNTGDYEHKDVVGKLTLGRIIKDNVTNIKVKPSVAFISEEKEYSINDRTVTIEGEVSVKPGDKIVLAASHNAPKGAAFLVESVVSSNGKTVIVGTKLKDITEVVDEFDYNEKIDVTNMQFIPDSNFKLNTTDSTLRSRDATEKISGNYEIEGKYKARLTVTGEIDYKVEYRNFLYVKYPIKARVTPRLKINSDIKLNVDAKSDGEIYLGRLKYIHPTGIAVEGDVYAFYDAEGHLDVHFQANYEAGVTVGYDNGRVFETNSELDASLNVKLDGRLYTGLKVTPELNWSELEAVKLTVNFGPEFSGEGEAEFSFNSSSENKVNLEYQLTGKVTWLKISGAFEIPILEKIPLLKKYHEIEFEKELFEKEYKKSNEGEGNEPIVSNSETSYDNIIDNYRKAIKENKTSDTRINIAAVKFGNESALNFYGSEFLSYGLFDIDGNGVEELIVFERTGSDYEIVDIYTKDKNNKVVKLLHKGNYGIAYHLTITKNKEFLVLGVENSDGAGFEYQVAKEFKLVDNGTKLDLQESLKLEPVNKVTKLYPDNKEYSYAEFRSKYERNSSEIMNFSGVKKTPFVPRERKIVNIQNNKFEKVFDDLNYIEVNKSNPNLIFTKLNVAINDWLIKNIAQNIDNISYTFYDINKDGEDELLLINRKYGNLIATYYLDKGVPKILAESYVAEVGGARSVYDLYQDGSILQNNWSSGTGNGVATISKLENGTVKKIKSLNYTALNFNVEDLGVKTSSKLNYNSLKWSPIKVS